MPNLTYEFTQGEGQCSVIWHPRENRSWMRFKDLKFTTNNAEEIGVLKRLGYDYKIIEDEAVLQQMHDQEEKEEEVIPGVPEKTVTKEQPPQPEPELPTYEPEGTVEEEDSEDEDGGDVSTPVTRVTRSSRSRKNK